MYRGVLILQEFELFAKYKSRTEYKFFDQLSRFEDELLHKLFHRAEINASFPNEHVLMASKDLISWFTKFTN